MAQMQRFGPADFILLLVIIAAAGGVRVAYVMTWADAGRNDGPLRVQDSRPLFADLEAGREGPTELDVLAANVSDNQYFGVQAPFAPEEEHTAHTSPGFPYLVGLAGTVLSEEQVGPAIRWA